LRPPGSRPELRPCAHRFKTEWKARAAKDESTIVQLWAKGLVPAWDALYRADGSARTVDMGGGAKLDWFDLGPPLDLDGLLNEDPDNLTHVDIHRCADIPIPDASGYLCGGDGAHGSQGFFARLDKDRNLVWIVALTDSNPFEKAQVHGRLATFTNNHGNSVTVDLDRPDYA
jgi:hypothetical protein